MSTCVRMQFTHMLVGLGAMVVPHRQHSLRAAAAGRGRGGGRAAVGAGPARRRRGAVHSCRTRSGQHASDAAVQPAAQLPAKQGLALSAAASLRAPAPLPAVYWEGGQGRPAAASLPAHSGHTQPDRPASSHMALRLVRHEGLRPRRWGKHGGFHGARGLPLTAAQARQLPVAGQWRRAARGAACRGAVCA